MIDVKPSGEACGATVTGVNLTQDLDQETIVQIKQAWWQHHVLAFPDQHLDNDDLERISQYFGIFGPEPFFEPMDNSEHVVAVCRRADEKAPLFAPNWHTDWSFQENPPIGTSLYGVVIPPVGGDTSYANLQLALKKMPDAMRQRFEGLKAAHSARLAYAPDGTYGDRAEEADRSMRIIYSDTAYESQVHDLVVTHPDSGNETIIGCAGYIIGLEGMAQEQASDLLQQLYAWQSREEFQYTHKWQENMLVIWDNRSVMHRANGGYDGYERELHRTTIYRPEGFLNPESGTVTAF